jgi:DNA polymerase-3 subunit delta
MVVHSGGGRAKAMADQLKKLGAEVHPCAKITKPAERADFVRREFKALKMKVDDATVTAILDAADRDVRELAAACSQLVADTDGQVDAAAVRQYHSGKAEVKGFEIADRAVAGDVSGAAEALRWAMHSGEPHVVLADALAEAVHTPSPGSARSPVDPYRLAGELGMPPWRIQKAQKQSRRWSRDRVAEAMRVVAALNADVKGAAADADYALESAVRKVADSPTPTERRVFARRRGRVSQEPGPRERHHRNEARRSRVKPLRRSGDFPQRIHARCSETATSDAGSARRSHPRTRQNPRVTIARRRAGQRRDVRAG